MSAAEGEFEVLLVFLYQKCNKFLLFLSWVEWTSVWRLCCKTQAHLSSQSLHQVHPFTPFLHIFSRFPLILSVLRLLSVTLGAFVPPGVNQLPHKQLLDQSCPGIFGVAAVGGDTVGLNHAAAPERVDLRSETHPTSGQLGKMANQAPRTLQNNLYLHQQVKGCSRLLTQHPELHTLCGGHVTQWCSTH